MPEPGNQAVRRAVQRVLGELRPGDVALVGSGLPSEVPAHAATGSGVQFLTETGLLGELAPSTSGGASGWVDSAGQPVALYGGGSVVATVDVGAMLRGGHVDAAILEPFQVDARGSFTHWTTAAGAGLHPPGWAVDAASGAKRVIALMPHVHPDGSPRIVGQLSAPPDGVGCVDRIITGLAVIRVSETGLILAELAPGRSADDVAAVTGAPLTIAPDLREMQPGASPSGAPGKLFDSGLASVSDIPDGAVVMIDGFAGPGGTPHYLLTSLRDHGARGLTIISNTAGIARVVNFGTPPGKQAIDHTILIDNGQVRKAVASYPVSPSASRPTAFELAYRRGDVELELVPQGTLAERLRAGGAGVSAFYTPTGVGTLIAEGKETRVIDGKEYVLEQALRADFCIIRGHQADTLGNVVYKGTSRNFNSVMAPAAAVTIVEVDEVVEPGRLTPEQIVTLGAYVDRIVVRPADFSPYE